MAWIELRDVGVCSLLLLLVALCFYNSLQNDFTFDDHLAIEQNFDMDERQVFSHLWVHDIWGKDLIEPDSHKSYRPLLISVFRFFWLNARKPMYYRIANIVSHAISTILVYFLAKQVFKGVKEHGGLMSIAAALFFATHPVHVEAVTAIVNLAEPLSSIFLIIAYFIFRADVYTTEGKGKALHSIVAGLLWLVCTVLAILIKETGIISSIFVWSFCGVLVVRSIWSKMTGGSHSFHLRGWVVCWWLALSSLLVYFYFSLRNVLVHHHRDQILGDWQRLLHEVIFFFKSNQAGSYLNSSQLLRRAENPFAFLKGEEKVFSMLVSLYASILLVNS